MKFRFSVLGIIWIITLVAMISAFFVARQREIKHQQLVSAHELVVADKECKTLLLKFLVEHDEADESAVEASETLKSIMRFTDWEEGLDGEVYLEVEFELVDVTPGSSDDQVEALLVKYDSLDSPGGNAIFILVFQDDKFLVCHSQAVATRMLQRRLELSCADHNGDGNLEFDVTEDGAIIYRYSLDGDKLVRNDFIVLKPGIFRSKEHQKNFEASGEHLAK